MQNTEHHCHLKGTISLVHAIKDDWWCNSYDPTTEIRSESLKWSSRTTSIHLYITAAHGIRAVN